MLKQKKGEHEILYQKELGYTLFFWPVINVFNFAYLRLGLCTGTALGMGAGRSAWEVALSLPCTFLTCVIFSYVLCRSS